MYEENKDKLWFLQISVFIGLTKLCIFLEEDKIVKYYVEFSKASNDLLVFYH